MGRNFWIVEGNIPGIFVSEIGNGITGKKRLARGVYGGRI